MIDLHPLFRPFQRPFRRRHYLYVATKRVEEQRKQIVGLSAKLEDTKGRYQWALKLLRRSNERAWKEAERRVLIEDMLRTLLKRLDAIEAQMYELSNPRLP